MSVSFLISQAKGVQKVIDENSAEIEVLDQKIGDGDHIFNIQRGVTKSFIFRQSSLEYLCNEENGIAKLQFHFFI